ncbi:MAG TPA: PASTA domain-containing protein [Crocinitomicaceae bacterium]|nr:PASTA domain-containing protein [Crocinitomicaceae bacterium]
MNFFKNIFKFIASKQFLINLGILFMVYVVVVIATIYYLNGKTNHGEKIEVPDYIGKNINDVSEQLDRLSLQYEVVDSIYDPEKAEGTIIYQDPMPSKMSDVYVKEGRKIRFRVSKKTKLIEIPLLVDRSERYANSVLKNMGVNAVITYQPSLEADGAVLLQKYQNKEMTNGQKIPVGATIYLVVGKGYSDAQQMLIPDLNCMTINQVKNRFGNSNVSIMENYTNCRTKEDSLNAKVIFQNPAYVEGEFLPSGTTMSITLDAKGCN